MEKSDIKTWGQERARTPGVAPGSTSELVLLFNSYQKYVCIRFDNLTFISENILFSDKSNQIKYIKYIAEDIMCVLVFYLDIFAIFFQGIPLTKYIEYTQ